MEPAKQLLSAIESTLLTFTPSPSQKIELIHAIRHSLPSLRSLFSFPPPKPSDRAQVESKEVRLPGSGQIPLDNQDVQIAIVLDQGLETDLQADILKYVEDLVTSGLRQRLISLIKITYSLLFSLIVSLILDALSASPNQMSILTQDASFRHDFHETASNEEGPSKVYGLLKGRMFWSISWNTLFDCLSIYEEKFKQSVYNAGPILPEIQEGDVKALVAYLCVLRKVVENGNPIKKKTWFPDIEPLFKLLSYENVPPYLKGALHTSISTFIVVSPNMKDTIWGFLEQYDLPVVVGPEVGQMMGSQVYDMRFELNEVEARSEHYPSTISFLNLLNALIADERDTTDRGRRILSMYDIKDEDIDIVVNHSQHVSPQSTPLQMQLPFIELLMDFMSGKTVFRNTMGILLLGVDAIIADGTSHTYGLLLEKAVLLSLEIAIKDATQGNESGKIMALFVLDALICIDHEKFFLSQLQSRGFLRSCLTSISNVSYQDNVHSVDPLQRLCALEAQFALLLRISHNRIFFTQGSLRRFDTSFGKDSFADIHRQRMVVSPSLRLVFSLTSLVETSDFFEVKNKIVCEVVDFVKGQQLLFEQVLRQDVADADELAMEQMNIVVGILSKVSGNSTNYSAPAGQQQPTLSLLGFLLNSVTTALENAAEEKSLLLNKEVHSNGGNVSGGGRPRSAYNSVASACRGLAQHISHPFSEQDKVGHNLKVFRRLAFSLKELTMQKLGV
ncbi:hypothetical protein SSX86_009912 [Deinandra increscens subsp. villosa]|uniref:Uncharacterized protein n=1 Tax=Deinandra increscens subsp. villosa TaxID=3103831 RepID=A0AAP0DAI6_9ASTR